MSIHFVKKLQFSFLVFLMIFSLFSCGNPGKKRSNVPVRDFLKEDEVQEDSKEPSFDLPRLHHKNVKKALTAFGKQNPETLVLLKTRLGTMKIKLYEDTPLHRANFLQLVKRGYYNGTVFHRVVKGMIIQGGNLDNSIIKDKKNEVGFYRVPAEMKPGLHYHKKGALASPRRDEGNPEKMSTPFEFYIVQGTTLRSAEVQALGVQNQITYTPSQLQAYTTLGGTPHLDGLYTVFGEVIEGLDVIDKIAGVEVDKADDWPFEDVIIEMKVVNE